MKRNYLGRFLAIALMCAGLTLTSCDENDNAIIDGKAITKSTDMIYDVDDMFDGEIYTTSTFYTIDGTTYKPVKVDEKWVLEGVK